MTSKPSWNTSSRSENPNLAVKPPQWKALPKTLLRGVTNYGVEELLGTRKRCPEPGCLVKGTFRLKSRFSEHLQKSHGKTVEEIESIVASLTDTATALETTSDIIPAIDLAVDADLPKKRRYRDATTLGIPKRCREPGCKINTPYYTQDNLEKHLKLAHGKFDEEAEQIVADLTDLVILPETEPATDLAQSNTRRLNPELTLGTRKSRPVSDCDLGVGFLMESHLEDHLLTDHDMTKAAA